MHVNAKFLGSYLKSDVCVATFHRPVKWALGMLGKPEGPSSGYQPHFFSEMEYCTTTRDGFDFQHPLNLSGILGGRALQLVIIQMGVWRSWRNALNKPQRYRSEGKRS